MNSPGQPRSLEKLVDQWRSDLLRWQAGHSVDAAELEQRLRHEISILAGAGLATDEAFVVAVKRMGDLDPLLREFALEHSERLWKQLFDVSANPAGARGRARTDAIVAFGLAVAAAVAVEAPRLFGLDFDKNEGFYTRNLSLFVLPFLTSYFVWKRRLATSTVRWLAVAFVAAICFSNVYPFGARSQTEMLTALHLPIALWLVVGIAYAGGRWSQVAGRMDFVRFTGQQYIFYVLIALGGGVFTAFLAMLFQAIGIHVEHFIQSWQVPCGAAGAVLVAAWLVEAKKGVIENIAPVLTRLFTPLFSIMLIAFLGAVVWTGRGVGLQRNVLVAFDLLLVVILGLLLYSISARDPHSPPGPFDVVQVVLVISALVADAVALWAIAARISEFGFSPNRVAALGENVVLLVNLAWSVVIYIGFLRRRGSFQALERWQTNYLPVYAMWAAIVVIAFPPLFGYS